MSAEGDVLSADRPVIDPCRAGRQHFRDILSELSHDTALLEQALLAVNRWRERSGVRAPGGREDAAGSDEVVVRDEEKRGFDGEVASEVEVSGGESPQRR